MLKKVISTFKEISSVPRCSHKEEKILNYLENWAKKHGFEYKIDNAKNIVIYVPATKGRENDETIILQNHMDMVCVKDKDSKHNFETDPIQVIEENNWLKANKTTLGADNGIGLSIALNMAFLPSHPNLEILITKSEEVGLIGALNLDPSILKGKKVINIDTEDLGEICVSSAGGVQINIDKNYKTKEGSFPQYKLSLYGMKGGHSGIDIDKNTYNSIHLFLSFFKKYKDIELVKFNGGVADNVIPKDFEAIIGIKDEEKFIQSFKNYIEELKKIYDLGNIDFKLERTNTKSPVIENIDKIINDILNIKIGIYSWSEKIENLVKTSNNLGILNIENGKIKIVYMARSSFIDDIYKIIEDIKENFKDYNIKNTDIYPGWEQDPNSKFVQDIKKIYDKYVKSKIVAYHAGLEVGAIVEKLGKGAEGVSIGPTIKGAHTTEERCDISSIDIIIKVLEEYLK